MIDDTRTSATVPSASTTARRLRLPIRRLAAFAAGAALVVAFGAGCSSSGTSTGAPKSDDATKPGCVAAKNGAVTIVTKQFDFVPDCVTTTGSRLKVTYENKEAGVQHNIDFKEAKASTGSAKTDLKSGPDTQTITLIDLKPGTYTYICDIHASMSGELTVK